jgi:hypothetical protein
MLVIPTHGLITSHIPFKKNDSKHSLQKEIIGQLLLDPHELLPFITRGLLFSSYFNNHCKCWTMYHWKHGRQYGYSVIGLPPTALTTSCCIQTATTKADRTKMDQLCGLHYHPISLLLNFNCGAIWRELFKTTNVTLDKLWKHTLPVMVDNAISNWTDAVLYMANTQLPYIKLHYMHIFLPSLPHAALSY